MPELPKNGWTPKRLDELGFVGRGKSRHRPRNDPSLYSGPYPFIQTAEIVAADCYVRSYTQTYSEKGLAQSKMWDTDTLCISIAGENTGATAILKFRSCFPDSVIGFVADCNKSDVHFVKYALDFMKNQIRAVTKGATQDNLSIEKLLSFPILTPPLPVQRKIAVLLSTYDELIANNAGRIRVLDETARALYREWFVKFRFPGSEKTSLVKTDLGDLPESWPIVKLAQLVDFERGVEPGSGNYLKAPQPDTVPFIRVGDLGKRAADNYVPRELVGETLIRRHDIAVSLDGSIGIVRLGMEGAYSTGIRKIVLRAPRIGWAFTYCLLQSDRIQEVIRTHAKGATILHAGSAPEFMRFPLPPAQLMSKFEEVAGICLKLMLNIQAKNANLRQTRDLLLPKLISGELDVSALEISPEEVHA